MSSLHGSPRIYLGVVGLLQSLHFQIIFLDMLRLCLKLMHLFAIRLVSQLGNFGGDIALMINCMPYADLKDVEVLALEERQA